MTRPLTPGAPPDPGVLGRVVPRPIVLKLGGELIESPRRVQAMGSAIAGLQGDAPLIVVHGGGKDIDAALARAGLSRRQVDGLRVTDEATLDIVVSVLAGLVNTRLVAAVNAAGASGVGLTGADASIGLVDKAPPHQGTDGQRVDLGRVGIPVRGRPLPLLETLYRADHVPIVACIGLGRSGELYNVNADTFAAHVAVSASATRLVIAGGTPGVLDDHGDTLPALDPAAIHHLVTSGTATAGMVAKLTACRDALLGGVDDVCIVSGHDLAGLTQAVRAPAGTPVPGGTRIARTLAEPAGPSHAPD